MVGFSWVKAFIFEAETSMLPTIWPGRSVCDTSVDMASRSSSLPKPGCPARAGALLVWPLYLGTAAIT